MRTLIVRIADAGPADSGLRGILEEPGEEPVTFHSVEDLVALMRSSVEPDSPAGPPVPPDPPD